MTLDEAGKIFCETLEYVEIRGPLEITLDGCFNTKELEAILLLATEGFTGNTMG